jgi:hypothetical protein
MKVLFLDFDGVLNSRRWFMENSKAIKENSGITWRHAVELDPAAVRRVLHIINETGAAVVISSSWRIIHTPDEIDVIFDQAGFPEMKQHIIDRTPYDLTHGVLRGEEIQLWIKQFEAKNGRLDNFVILDDDSDMLPSQKEGHFVQTSRVDGIQDVHVKKAIQILGAAHVQI